MSDPTCIRPLLVFTTARRRLACLLRRLASDRGVASIEIALIVPMLALLLVGFDETYMFIRTRYTIEHTAYALTNSVGQFSNVVDSTSTTSSNTLGSIWKVATTLAAPVQLQSSGAVFITSICDLNFCSAPDESAPTGTGTPTILWQRSAPWSASGLVSQVTPSTPLPSTFPFHNGDAAFVVEVYYTFDPFAWLRGFWPGAPGAQQLYERFYARPRGTSIQGNAPIPLTAS
jgi:Flp pilus assembly protein TadG